MKAYLLFLKIRMTRGLRKGLFKAIVYLLTSFGLFFYLSEREKTNIIVYAWFRKIDDIIDGEEVWDGNIDTYIHQKKNILKGDFSVCLEEDTLFIYLIELTKKYDINIWQEVKDLFEAMENEYGYRNKFVPKKELHQNWAKQDKAIFSMISKIVGEEVYLYSNSELSEFWGIFTRVDSLKDIKEDVKQGIINIPLEDALKYKMNIDELISSSNLESISGFKEWYEKENKEVLEEMEKVISIIKKRNDLPLFNFVFSLNNIRVRVL
ncbi:MAG: class 1 isoprenoid biosynthesis enzyme [Minisyncoccales bacterium]